MFVFNYFKHQRPTHVDPQNHKTIAWNHLSDPTVKWALIDKVKTELFLRTASGNPPCLKPNGLEWLEYPDEHITRHTMKKFLHDRHVSSMAAPGVAGCGEPCCCGGHQSKHVSGEACDLHGLDTLGMYIMAAEPGKYKDPTDAVDEFLHQHGLHRPMAHLKGKQQELWHVEAVPPHVRHLSRHHAKIYLQRHGVQHVH